MPIYLIETAGEEAKRLVKAPSSAAAIAHCAKAKFSASLVTKVEDVADLLSEGVRIENLLVAVETPAAPEELKAEAPGKSETKAGKADESAE